MNNLRLQLYLKLEFEASNDAFFNLFDWNFSQTFWCLLSVYQDCASAQGNFSWISPRICIRIWLDLQAPSSKLELSELSLKIYSCKNVFLLIHWHTFEIFTTPLVRSYLILNLTSEKLHFGEFLLRISWTGCNGFASSAYSVPRACLKCAFKDFLPFLYSFAIQSGRHLTNLLYLERLSNVINCKKWLLILWICDAALEIL